MTPKNDETYGHYKIVFSDASSEDRSYLALTDRVQNVISSTGDKLHPTPHAYETLRNFAYSGTIEERNPTTLELTRGQYGTMPESDLYSSINAPHSITSYYSKLYNRALSQLNEKIRGSLDLSVSLAESHSTGKMLSSIGKLESYVRSQNWARSVPGAQVLKTAGMNWLAYNLAWRPLVSDIYGVVDEYYRSTMPKMAEFTGKASEKLGPALVNRAISGYPKILAQREGIAGVHIHVRFKDKGFDIARWTSLNPASIAWELMPYSFVVDYFYDIGSMIRNAETAFLYNNQFDSGYVTTLFAETASVRDKFQKLVSGVYVDRDVSSSYKAVNFQRTVLGSYPLPRAPVIRMPDASSQLLTLASLLALKLR